MDYTFAPRGNPPLISPAALAERTARHKKILFMVDYDGTVVPIAPTPEQARPDKKLLKTFARLVQKPEYTLAILSGRRLEELIELLPVSGLYLAGVHGAWIRRPDGVVVPLVKIADGEKAIPVLYALALEVIKNQPGFIVENKRYTLAIHYRLAEVEAAKKILGIFIKESEKLRQQFALELLRGKKILEVRPQGLHKGNPVSWLKKNLSGHFCIYLGDDTTDEDAFQLIAENGLGILVSEYPRPSYASLRLKSPSEVYQFLELIAQKNVQR
jgi:trehalose 6-phosphate phosphatase